MRNIIVLFIFVISVVSCSPTYKTYEINKFHGQQQFYILDTITIDSAKVICYDNVYYVVSNTKLEKKHINAPFGKDTEVFLYDGKNVGLYFYIDNEKNLKKYYCTYDKGLDKTYDYYIGKKSVPVYSFKQRINRFLLCMVNVNYFNRINSGFETTDKGCKIIPLHIKDSNCLNNYRKIVFPLCD